MDKIACLPATKICQDCSMSLLLDEFHKSSNGKFGRCAYCKPCERRRGTKYRAANSQKIKKAHAAYYEKNKGRKKADASPQPELPSCEELKNLLQYDSETGIITNRGDRNGRAQNGAEAGNVRPDGYRIIRLQGHDILAHRLAWMLHFGEWPAHHIDHINHSKADNRIVNLRVVTRAENQRNMSRARNNTSGITGVCWNKCSKKWQASISAEGKQIYLGLHDNLFLAYLARRGAERKYGYHENHGVAA